MSFISREQEREVSKWIKEHPIEARQLQKEHNLLYAKLVAKEITLEQFIEEHEKLREKYQKVKP